MRFSARNIIVVLVLLIVFLTFTGAFFIVNETKQAIVLHFGEPGEGPKLEPGMFLTIEPMINAGKFGVKMLNDGWTAVTKDKSLSAQFEHTIGITEDGNEIFTLSKNNTDFPINDL